MLRPAPVHAATLVAGLVLLLVVGRDQWFVRDDWAILDADPDWFAPHQGHWSTVPTLLFAALRATVGLHSYLPYLALAVLAHLAVVHLLWRIMRASGVAGGTATALAAIVIPLGCAAENLLWAFQVGFMGAIAMGLLLLLLVGREHLTPAVAVAAVTVATIAPAFSGTALPFLAAAFVLGWVRRGWWRSALLLAPAGLVYGAWYLLAGGGSPTSLAPQGLELVTVAPLFVAVMFGAGYGQFTGVLLLGPVVALGILAWLVVRRRVLLGAPATAAAVLLASLVFAILTAATRSGGELTAAGSQRYVDLVVVGAIPVIGLIVDDLARRARAVPLVAGILGAAVLAVNLGLLVGRAEDEARLEQGLRERVAAAVDIDGPSGAIPAPDLAPDLTLGEVHDLAAEGRLDRVPYSPAARTAVERAIAG